MANLDWMLQLEIRQYQWVSSPERIYPYKAVPYPYAMYIQVMTVGALIWPTESPAGSEIRVKCLRGLKIQFSTFYLGLQCSLSCAPKVLTPHLCSALHQL